MNEDLVVCQNCGSELSLKKLKGKIDLKTKCYVCKDNLIFPYIQKFDFPEHTWELKEQYKKEYERVNME